MSYKETDYAELCRAKRVEEYKKLHNITREKILEMEREMEIRIIGPIINGDK